MQHQLVGSMGALLAVNRVDYLRIQIRNPHVSLVQLDFVEGGGGDSSNGDMLQ